MKTGILALWVWALTGATMGAFRAGAAESTAATRLHPGPAVVAAERLNVRGEPRLEGERVAQLERGDQVWVFEEIVVEKPKPGEPDRWARIALPRGTKAWIHSLYVDPTNRVVLASRLNLRAGPGENHSVLGTLERGETYEETGVMDGDWIQIVPPTNAWAFVAARYLAQEPVASEPPAPTTESSTATAARPTTTPPVQPAPSAEPQAPAVPQPTPVTVTSAPELAAPPEPTNEIATAAFQEPPAAQVAADPAALEKAREAMRQKMAELIARDEALRAAAAPPTSEVRVVTREGIVRRARHILAPTPHALTELETGRVINYLYTTSTNLDLSRYWGRHVLVTGEEGLDPRWQATPVLTVRRIQVFP
jgi:uncharacterized protein YgiM (DUF1202 family)